MREEVNIQLKYIPCGYAYKVVCREDPSLTKEIVLERSDILPERERSDYSPSGCGNDAVYNFLKEVNREVMEINNIREERRKKFRSVKNMIISEEQKEEYKKAEYCHICERKLCERRDKNGELQIIKVRDHCHFTGKYRGPAHKKCKLNYRLDPTTPIVFHNLRGYDGKFLIQEMGRVTDSKIKVIPNSGEKFMAIMTGRMVFIDSFQFIAGSLDSHVSNILKGEEDEDGNIIKPPVLKEVERFCINNGYNYELLRKKGIYPYEYMDSFDKLREEKLPSHKDFYSKLIGEIVSEEEYERALEVFNSYCKNLGDYHDLYLKMDVLLLSEVFEGFRSTCLNYYKLDPVYYFSAPGLAWDAMLKMSGVKLDLISDIEMSTMVERGMRGGLVI